MKREGLSIALIGCGQWGKNLARNFYELGCLVAVSDTDAGRAGQFAEAYSLKACTLEQIFADSAIDAVAIATPAITHAALAKQALQAGKHVFVEKPLAMDTEEAHELCVLADSSARMLMVGHLMRYHPAFKALTEICDSGRLGRIRHVYSNRLNLGRIRTEENILWSFAPHDISMILRVMGMPPEEVTAFGHALRNGDIQDMTITSMTFPGDRAAHVYVSWLHPFKEQRFVVVGEDGMAVFDDGKAWEQKLAVFDHNVTWNGSSTESMRGEPVWIAVDQDEPLKRECEVFLKAISGGTKPETDGWEGLEVLKVLKRAQACLDINVVASSKSEIAEDAYIHESAVVDEGCRIGAKSRIWHFSHILKNSWIGQNCNLGQNVMVGPNVSIGNGCKIQNNVSVYPGVTLEDNVFCGPSMTFTNVINPRSEIERKDEFKPTLVRQGATIGANATIVCGTVVGRYAFVGAGAVVTRDVPDFGLVVGNPARLIGHMCACGERLPGADTKEIKCKSCARRYCIVDGEVSEVS